MRLLAVVLSLWVASPCWGATGGSRSFDGTNDQISWGNISQLDNTTLVSCGGWTNVANITQDHLIVGTRNVGAGWLFFNDDVGSVSGRTDIYTIFVQESGATGNNSVRIEGATSSEAANRWDFVAFSFQANVANGLRLYINGVEDANSPVSTVNVDEAGNNGLALLFGESNGGSFDRNGLLAHVQCWNAVVTLVDLQEARFKPGLIPTSLQLSSPSWGTESPEKDLSGKGLSGTVTGATTSTNGPPVMIGGAPL